MHVIAVAPAGVVGLVPSWLRWLLARGWCWLAGGALRRSLRSALGGGPAEHPGPPTRPRRPKAPRSRRAQSPLPYPSAA